MRDILCEVREKLEEGLKEWPHNFPKNIPKKVFNKYVVECNELLKNFPKQKLDDDTSENGINGEGKAGAMVSLNKTPRMMKIQELQKKLDELRGKSLNRKISLKKKGLKNRLKKKIYLEQRAKIKSEKLSVKQNGEKENEEDHSHDGITAKSDESEPSSLVYSKFDFHSNDESGTKTGPRDPMRILQKVEKSKRKLDDMEAKGRDDKVKKIKEKLIWDAAIKKAEGVKVKDDIELLKKSIRKKKNMKNRSKKKWDEREKTKVQRMEDAQKKRKANLQSKKKEKQKKKIKKLVKKGRIAL